MKWEKEKKNKVSFFFFRVRSVHRFGLAQKSSGSSLVFSLNRDFTEKKYLLDIFTHDFFGFPPGLTRELQV